VQAEDELQRHTIVENTSVDLLERTHVINRRVLAFAELVPEHYRTVQSRREVLVGLNSSVEGEVRARRTVLEAAVSLQQFYQQAQEVELWVATRTTSAASADFGRDLTGVDNISKKHNKLATDVSE
jgi:spectrin alpha